MTVEVRRVHWKRGVMTEEQKAAARRFLPEIRTALICIRRFLTSYPKDNKNTAFLTPVWYNVCREKHFAGQTKCHIKEETNMRILATDGLAKPAVERLTAGGHEVVEEHFEQSEVGNAIRDFDVVVVRSATKVKEAEIDAAKGSRLKLIVRAGVGLDNISVDYARAAGIEVRNTPKAPSNAVAELALGFLLSCARGIAPATHDLREQKWDKKGYSKGIELEGKVCGIIGYGRIGQCLGRKVQALGMHVLSVVHCHKPADCESETMQFVSMQELLERSDFIVLCAPPAEKPILDADAFADMKDGVSVINVSRAKNLDENALYDALNSGKVRAAGIDVWMTEKAANWYLAGHPHVTATPHIGSGTAEAQRRIGEEVVEIIEEKSRELNG